jgi:hypothetical protein
MPTPKVGQIYRHRFIIEGGPAEGPQTPNRFRVVAVDSESVSTVPEGSMEAATRWMAGTFDTLFERVKGKGKKRLL